MKIKQSLNFEDLTLNGQYWTGKVENQRGLRLWVTADDRVNELTSHLYQLPLEAGPENQFEGGHGFTGLT